MVFCSASPLHQYALSINQAVTSIPQEQCVKLAGPHMISYVLVVLVSILFVEEIFILINAGTECGITLCSNTIVKLLRILYNVGLDIHSQMSTNNSNTYVRPTTLPLIIKVREYCGPHAEEVFDKHMYCCYSYSSDHGFLPHPIN